LAILHVLSIKQEILFFERYALFSFVSQSLFSLGLWIIGSLGIFYISWIFGKKVSFARAEAVAFRFWMIWAIMPFFDLPHLFGLPLLKVGYLVFHVSYIPCFSIFAVMFFFFCKDELDLHKGQMIYALLLALTIPFFVRLGLETVPENIELLFGILRNGNSINYWTAMFVAFAAAIPVVYFLRQHAINGTKRGLFVSAAFAFLVLGTAFCTINPGNPPIVTTGEFSGISLKTGSRTWYSADYETTGTRTLSSSDLVDHSQNYDYVDVVDMDFNPSNPDFNVTWIRCIVRITTPYTDGSSADNSPNFRCSFRGGNSNWRDGNWIYDTNGDLNGNYTMEWNSSYVNWVAMKSELTQSDNDVRVTLETDGYDDTSSSNADWYDVISFDSVWIRVYYQDVSNATVNASSPVGNQSVYNNTAVPLTCTVSCTNEDTTCSNIYVYPMYCNSSLSCSPVYNITTATPDLRVNTSSYLISSMTAGTTTMRTFNVTGNKVGNYTLSCRVNSPNPISYNSTYRPGITVVGYPNLTLSQDTPSNKKSNSTFEVQITLLNIGKDTAAAINLTEIITGGSCGDLEIDESTITNGAFSGHTFDSGAGKINWTGATLLKDASTTVKFNITTPICYLETFYENVFNATVRYIDLKGAKYSKNDLQNMTIAAYQRAHLLFSIDPEEITKDIELKLTMTLTSDGDKDISSIDYMNVTIPVTYTVDSGSISDSGTWDSIDRVIEWTSLGELNISDTKDLEFNVTSSNLETSTLTATGDYQDSVGSLSSTNPLYVYTLIPDLSSSFSPSLVKPGGTTTLTVSVENTFSDTISNIVIIPVLPEGFSSSPTQQQISSIPG
jgi:uncharacterized repeat protein (TIGR01451 family)